MSLYHTEKIVRSPPSRYRYLNKSEKSDATLGEDTAITKSTAALPKRQFSHTQSEPETCDPPLAASAPVVSACLERSVTFNEPRIKVIPPATMPAASSVGAASGSGRAGLLMHMHTEYASITDELESVCGLLSPPRSPGLLSPPRPPDQSPPSIRKRNPSEMSNPEMAINFEKEHLRSAEECDYMVMENLIQRRYEEEEDDDDGGSQDPALLSVVAETREYRLGGGAWPARSATLRRAEAVEGEPQLGTLGSSSSSTDRQDSTESNTSTMNQPSMPQRPSIVIDSSQLPIQREVLIKSESKNSLHMQSETMC